ncbi:response regulator [Azospirillum picis]|uniref:Two-component system torCAD operon response regulator TorR n=1 Tax=Azospirillum picis TaxID=488438 RepID=A0ABU0MPP6_9PROT|nr:response regulator [Azospirillum picis]MBP2301342.1 two-component system torCAD operon response regulator TorR [Azospirillum picis]MDQ0535173.1 two-component system torCAD operon response regulator TorR [Azospirillum picis]
MHTIAVVDDDPITRETLRAYLEGEGYRVMLARDGDQLSALLARARIDLLLLDIRLPGKDGLAVTRDLRASSNIGIILITGRSDRMDRLIGLELGADDYITKPFEPREILARTRSLLRRVGGPAKPVGGRVKRFDGWELHLDKRRLRDPGGGDARLTSAEFDLLAAFVEHPGRVLSRDDLLDLTLRGDAVPFDRSIDRLVRRLRRVVEPDPAEPTRIVTVHGMGYMFQAAVD